MDIQALKLKNKGLVFAFCVGCFGSLFSCSDDKSKDEESQRQQALTTVREERMKATELAFEYEQFVNRMWRELYLLSDSLTDLQVNKEVRTPMNRKQRMASIEKHLRELEARLREAESNAAFNESDGQAIKELRTAIKRKDTIIRKLKKENNVLREVNNDLSGRLERKEAELRIKDQNLYEKERQLHLQKRASAGELEKTGDYLRRIVIRMGSYKGSGIYESYKASQIKMLETSINCYDQAYRIFPTQGIYNKMVRTRSGLERYRNTKDLTALDF